MEGERCCRQRGGGEWNVLGSVARRAGLRGGSFAGICLAAALLLVGVGGVDGGTTCTTVEYTHEQGSPCGSAPSFNVHRCAESAEALKAYLKAQRIDDKLTLDGCKHMWLRGCANFYKLQDRFVVVPKDISCNNEVCDQSSMYSNCVTDKHCAGIDSVADGPFPHPKAVWPFASDPTKSMQEDGLLPQHRPCCSFFELYCNGASCLGRDSDTCPLQIARNDDRCSDDDCWVAGAAAGAAGPALLLALASSLVALVASKR